MSKSFAKVAAYVFCVSNALPAFESLPRLAQLLSLEEAQWGGPQKAQKSQRHKKCAGISKKRIIKETKAEKRDTAQLWNAHIEPRKEREKPLLSDNNPPSPDHRDSLAPPLLSSFGKVMTRPGITSPCVRPVEIIRNSDTQTTEHLPSTPVFQMPTSPAPLFNKRKPISGEGIDFIVKGLALAFRAHSWAL